MPQKKDQPALPTSDPSPDPAIVPGRKRRKLLAMVFVIGAVVLATYLSPAGSRLLGQLIPVDSITLPATTFTKSPIEPTISPTPAVAAFAWTVNNTLLMALPTPFMALNVPFSAPLGTRVSDFSGNAISLTNVINTANREAGAIFETNPVNCKVGTCMTFGTVGKRYLKQEAPSPLLDALGKTRSFSVEAWVKYTQSQMGSIVSKRNAAPNSDYSQFDLNVESYVNCNVDSPLEGRSVCFRICRYNGSGSICSGVASLAGTNTSDGAWHHAVGTYSLETKEIGLYIDGIRQGSNPFRSGPTIDTSGQLLHIGKLGNSDDAGYFNGSIDEVKIYPRVLSPEQIALNFTEGNLGKSGPATVAKQETLGGELWNLGVTAIDDQTGQPGTAVAAASPTRITIAAFIPVPILPARITEVESLAPLPQNYGELLLSYDWSRDPDGAAGPMSPEQFMSFNMPFNKGEAQVNTVFGSSVQGAAIGLTEQDASQCRVGICYRFPGSTAAYVSLSARPYTGSGPFTVEAWVSPTDLANGQSPSGRMVIKSITQDGGTPGSMMLSLTRSKEVYLYAWKTTGSYTLTKTAINTVLENQWSHIAAAWDGQRGQIFINGQSVGVTESTGGGTGLVPGHHIGMGALDEQNRNFKGMMDELKIYPRALTTAQIAQNCADGNAGTPCSSGIQSSPGVGGPSHMVPEETRIGETWSLAVVPMNEFGEMDARLTAATSTEIVRSNESIITVNLNGSLDPLTVTRGVNITPDIGNLGSDTTVYQWTIPPDGTAPRASITTLDIPFNAGDTQVSWDSSGILAKAYEGAVYTETGCKVGGCLQFGNTGNAYVQLSARPSGSNGSFTIEAWVSPTDLATSNSQSGRMVLKSITQNTGVPGDMMLSLSRNREVYLYAWKTSGTYTLTKTAINTVLENQWSHIAAVWDGQRGRIFVSGQSVGVTESTGGGTGLVPGHHIGMGALDEQNRNFKGMMDELKIYSKALTAEQVLKNFTDGSSGLATPSQIVGAQTTAGEVWDLTVTNIAPNGGVGTSVHSANTVTIANGLSFSTQNQPLSETTTSLVSVTSVTVVLSSAAGQDTPFTMAIGGTATPGVDFTSLLAPGLILPAGSPQVTVPVFSLLNDPAYENDETITLTLSSSASGVVVDSTPVIFTIQSEDLMPFVRIRAVTPEGQPENVGEIPFEIILSSDPTDPANEHLISSELPVRVNYSIAPRTGDFITPATPASDYTFSGSSSGTITIPAGQQVVTIGTVTLVNDTMVEEHESFQLRIDTPLSARLPSGQSANTVPITIVNDDYIVGFSAATSAGDEIVSAANISVVVTGTGRRDTITVDYRVETENNDGGTAVEGTDYTLTSGTLTFPSGQREAFINLSIVADTLFEQDETVFLILESPTVALLNPNIRHTSTIRNSNLQPIATIDASSPSGGPESISTAVITIRLSAISGADTAVQYSVSSGSATAGQDFTAGSGTITIPAGQTVGTLSPQILDDNLDENDQTILITLIASTGATLGSPSVHTYTIEDDDQPPEVNLTSATSDGLESEAPVQLDFTLSAPSELPITIAYAINSQSTATGLGIDYTLAVVPVDFSPGQTSKKRALILVEDPLNEISETVVVTLSDATNAVQGANREFTYTIRDNDPQPSAQFSQAPIFTTEPSGRVEIPVTLSSASGQQVSVNYSVSGGSATGSRTDYTLDDGLLTFPPGQTTRNILVTITNDSLNEADETIEITLSAPQNAVLASPSVHTLTIQDNDTAGTIGFASTQSSGNESNASLSLTVETPEITGQDITFSYAVSNGTAQSEDFTPVSGNATITTGQTSTTFTIIGTIADDITEENPETILITLSAPRVGSLSSASSTHTYTILNDDQSPPTLLVTQPASVPEDSGPLRIQLSNISPGGNDSQTVTIDASTQSSLLMSPIQVSYPNPDSASATLTVNLAPNANGTAAITLTVSDSGGSQITPSPSIPIIITPVNDPPQVIGSRIYSGTEDESGTFTITGLAPGPPTAVDESTQTVTAMIVANTSANFRGLSISSIQNGSATVSYTPAQYLSGALNLILTLRDSSGDLQTNATPYPLILNLLEVNDPPTINPIVGSLTLMKDSVERQTISINGLGPGPNETQSFTVTLPHNLQLVVAELIHAESAATGTITLQPIPGQTGTESIIVTVTDEGGAITTQTLIVRVIEPPPETLPENIARLQTFERTGSYLSELVRQVLNFLSLPIPDAAP